MRILIFVNEGAANRSLATAYDDVLRTAARLDRSAGYDVLTKAAELLRGIAEDAADLRALLVADMYDGERTTYAQLGERLGLSLPRTAELVQSGRKVRAAGKRLPDAVARPARAVVEPAVVQPVDVVPQPPVAVPTPDPVKVEPVRVRPPVRAHPQPAPVRAGAVPEPAKVPSWRKRAEPLDLPKP